MQPAMNGLALQVAQRKIKQSQILLKINGHQYRLDLFLSRREVKVLHMDFHTENNAFTTVQAEKDYIVKNLFRFIEKAEEFILNQKLQQFKTLQSSAEPSLKPASARLTSVHRSISEPLSRGGADKDGTKNSVFHIDIAEWNKHKKEAKARQTVSQPTTPKVTVSATQYAKYVVGFGCSQQVTKHDPFDWDNELNWGVLQNEKKAQLKYSSIEKSEDKTLTEDLDEQYPHVSSDSPCGSPELGYLFCSQLAMDGNPVEMVETKPVTLAQGKDIHKEPNLKGFAQEPSTSIPVRTKTDIRAVRREKNLFKGLMFS
ncbi:hypothetical protein D5018_09065 [Parashewanella curva]|uniref:Uncharacterized protein n=2 Tax=Parashewanella curva TaxID=2338552 RepID=A0A3L8Q0Y1_9GAMM|nr:hypothetical protein D5018_09065 [Parashewanella curva]